MANSRTEFDPQRLLERLKRYACEGAYRVALSGGADSTALLLAMADLREELPQPVHAVHVNHGWHADADEWERHCQALCGDLAVPLRSIRVQADLKRGQGPEAALREQRYQAFEALLETGDLLLLAHQRDDQAETVLLNLMRGSGVEGLAGMPETRTLGSAALARPLLGYSRVDLESFLESRGIRWLVDPGNRDEGPDRNYLRLRILPLLRTRWPAVDRALARSAGHCEEAWGLLRDFGRDLLRSRLCNARVLAVDPGWTAGPALLKLLLRLWFEQVGTPPVPGVRLQEFIRQLAESQADAVVELAWAEWRLRRFRDRLWLQAEAEVSACPERKWSGARPLDLGPSLGTLSLEPPPSEAPPFELDVGRRAEAERMLLRGKRQSVKERLRAAGVPPWLRDSVPFLRHAGELVALGDWEVAGPLRDWLERIGATIRWQPLDPVLELVRSECHRRPVESHRSLG